MIRKAIVLHERSPATNKNIRILLLSILHRPRRSLEESFEECRIIKLFSLVLLSFDDAIRMTVHRSTILLLVGIGERRHVFLEEFESRWFEIDSCDVDFGDIRLSVYRVISARLRT